LEAKYFRFPAKNFTQSQTNYANHKGSHGKQGLKTVDIAPLLTMPLLQNTMNF